MANIQYTEEFAFYQQLKFYYDSNRGKIRSRYNDLTKKFLAYNDKSENPDAFLRLPQFEALEMYVFIKEFMGNPQVYELFDDWRNRRDKFSDASYYSVRKGGQIRIFDNESEIVTDTLFKQMKKYKEAYPNYIYALTMGLGKLSLWPHASSMNSCWPTNTQRISVSAIMHWYSLRIRLFYNLCVRLSLLTKPRSFLRNMPVCLMQISNFIFWKRLELRCTRLMTLTLISSSPIRKALTQEQIAKSFHADTYCFDSKPEKECFLQYITNSKIKEVYFTGMFTANQGDLSVQYYDPESGRIRHYYPDFLAKLEDGSYQLIEVKGDNKIDDTVVKAKAAAAQEMAVASGIEYKMYAGSEIMTTHILAYLDGMASTISYADHMQQGTLSMVAETSAPYGSDK